MTWHGVRTLKLPSDMWNYQEIIFERRIEHVIETGTRHGGSALFFAETLAARGGPARWSRSTSTRRCEPGAAATTGIHFLLGDSASPAMVERVAGAAARASAGRSSSSSIRTIAPTHVLRELRAWVPLLQLGRLPGGRGQLVNGHPVRPEYGPGRWRRSMPSWPANPGVLIPDPEREEKFACTFAPRGYFTKK